MEWGPQVPITDNQKEYETGVKYTWTEKHCGTHWGTSVDREYYQAFDNPTLGQSNHLSGTVYQQSVNGIRVKDSLNLDQTVREEEKPQGSYRADTPGALADGQETNITMSTERHKYAGTLKRDGEKYVITLGKPLD